MAETKRIPLSLLTRLAKRYGYRLVDERELEVQLNVTSVILDAAFVMYDALELITKLDSQAAPNAAALIARRAKKDVDSRVIGAEGDA